MFTSFHLLHNSKWYNHYTHYRLQSNRLLQLSLHGETTTSSLLHQDVQRKINKVLHLCSQHTTTTTQLHLSYSVTMQALHSLRHDLSDRLSPLYCSQQSTLTLPRAPFSQLINQSHPQSINDPITRDPTQALWIHSNLGHTYQDSYTRASPDVFVLRGPTILQRESDKKVRSLCRGSLTSSSPGRTPSTRLALRSVTPSHTRLDQGVKIAGQREGGKLEGD